MPLCGQSGACLPGGSPGLAAAWSPGSSRGVGRCQCLTHRCRGWTRCCQSGSCSREPSSLYSSEAAERPPGGALVMPLGSKGEGGLFGRGRFWGISLAGLVALGCFRAGCCWVTRALLVALSSSISSLALPGTSSLAQFPSGDAARLLQLSGVGGLVGLVKHLELGNFL